MDKIINYTSHYTKKPHAMHFKNLLETGGNIDKYVLEDKLFERMDHNYGVLFGFIKPGDIVWDIGAYIGTFSIPFAIEGMEVYAFEGFPANFERLKINCAPFKIINVFLCALSNENRTVTSKFNDCTDHKQKRAEIQYFVFDDYVKEHDIPFPKLIKMDIEGMESLALLGMSNILENIRPVWQIGYHHPGNILIENPEQKIDGYPGFVIPEEGGFDFEVFEKLDYCVFNLNQGGIQGKFLWGDCNGEYLCVPKELLRRES